MWKQCFYLNTECTNTWYIWKPDTMVWISNICAFSVQYSDENVLIMCFLPFKFQSIWSRIQFMAWKLDHLNTNTSKVFAVFKLNSKKQVRILQLSVNWLFLMKMILNWSNIEIGSIVSETSYVTMKSKGMCQSETLVESSEILEIVSWLVDNCLNQLESKQ